MNKLILGVLLVLIAILGYFLWARFFSSGSEIVVEEAPYSSQWVYPGKVYIGEIGPGSKAEVTFYIFNGHSKDLEYDFSVIIPNKTEKGFYSDSQHPDWISFYQDDIKVNSILVKSGETVEVTGVLSIPRSSRKFLKSVERFEIWTETARAKPIDIGGHKVRLALNTRWLITTKYYGGD